MVLVKYYYYFGGYYKLFMRLFADLAVEFIESIAATADVKPKRPFIAWLERGRAETNVVRTTSCDVPHSNFHFFLPSVEDAFAG